MSESDASQPEDVYEVESIVQKKILVTGKICYLIKWKDYDASENTWEPEENLECQDLIDEFNKHSEKIVIDERKKPTSKKRSSSQKPASQSSNKKSASSKSNQTTANATSKTGFDEGLTVESILGATDAAGELMFLIKWKERNEASLIAARICNVKCPQHVISYLQEKITFLNDSAN